MAKKILLVDDEEFNLDILDEYLKDYGFETVLAVDGIDALEKLKSSDRVDAIILDRMMPNMDGLQFLKAIKTTEEYGNIPVIMQTAATSKEQVLEGIDAGAFYYLTKPYERQTLLAILCSALEQKIIRESITDQLVAHKTVIKMLQQGKFVFRTLEEGKELATTIANLCPEPDKALFGLNELILNAVEHGNLGISYEEKKELVTKNSWMEELKRRISLPENSSKFVTLHFEIKPDYIEIRIKDMGNGFDYKKFTSFGTDRIKDPNGRGIAMSKIYSFSTLEYSGNGNEAICRIIRN